MKMMYLVACILSAAALSGLAALYASGQLDRVQDHPDESATRIAHPTLFPQQNRAVEELLREIVARQTALEGQERQLEERESRVRQEEIVLSRMRDEMNAIRRELENHFDEIEAVERVNVRKLAEFYSKMDAANAARLLSDMEPSRAAWILAVLGDRQAGAIMDAAVLLGDRGIERALEWSDTIRRMKTAN